MRNSIIILGGAELFSDVNLALFLTASLALIVTPGPDMIYVGSRWLSSTLSSISREAWVSCSVESRLLLMPYDGSRAAF